MLDFKKICLLSTLFLIATPQAFASDEVGYYMFGQYRYFGPKMRVAEVPDGIDNNTKAAQRFFPSLAKQNYNYFKNVARTFKDGISYGDWDKPYRVMFGYERDDRHIRTSKGTYGHRDYSNNLFLMADKAYANNYWRLGAGLSLSDYQSEYDNGAENNQKNSMAMLYAIYNDAPNQIRLRSRAYLGYGKNDVKRLAEVNDNIVNFSSNASSTYYGFENTLTKTFSHDSGLYLQPSAEFNGFGITRNLLSENNNGTSLERRSTFLLEGLAGIFAGIKGSDNFGNKYNFKIGPEITYIFSSPYEGYTSLDDIQFKDFHDRKDVITWKAYLNYDFSNGFGIYSDLRYYHKGDDNIAGVFGVNYRF